MNKFCLIPVWPKIPEEVLFDCSLRRVVSAHLSVCPHRKAIEKLKILKRELKAGSHDVNEANDDADADVEPDEGLPSALNKRKKHVCPLSAMLGRYELLVDDNTIIDEIKAIEVGLFFLTWSQSYACKSMIWIRF